MLKTTSTNEKTVDYLMQNFTEKSYFDILIIITIIFHSYIDSELYNLAYGKFKLGSINRKFKTNNGFVAIS